MNRTGMRKEGGRSTERPSKNDAKTVNAGRRDEVESDSDDEMLQRTQLDLSSNPLPPVVGLITAMQRLRNLQKLDLSSMQPSNEAGNPNGLDSLEWLGKAISKSRGTHKRRAFGHALSWLKFSDNKALGEQRGEEAWKGMDQLTSLIVLNASSCALPVAPPASVLLSWTSLAALVLGHNNIERLEHFPSMPQLNTLVLSHNKITSLPRDLPASLPALKKLSMTHNDLHWGESTKRTSIDDDDDDSPLPDFALCSHLREVRISGNVNLRRLPSHLQKWGKGVGSERKGTGLEMLEAGDCGFVTLQAIAPLLKIDQDSTAVGQGSIHPSRRRVRGITTLLLKGNLVTKEEGYRKQLLATHPALRVLDNEKIFEPAKDTKSAPDLDIAAPSTDRKSKARPTTTSASPFPKEPSQNQHKAFEQRPRKMSSSAPKQTKQTAITQAEKNGAKTDERSQIMRIEKNHKEAKATSINSKKVDLKAKIAEEPKKPRKRGSRGKAKGKAESASGQSSSPAVTGDAFLVKAIPSAKQKQISEKTPSSGGKASRTDGEKTNATKSGLKTGKTQEKKRKAIDSQDEPSERRAPVSQTETAHEASKSKPDKELTAVAGIVNVQSVNKRRKTDENTFTSKAAAWGQRNELTLGGTGGAWN